LYLLNTTSSEHACQCDDGESSASGTSGAWCDLRFWLLWDSHLKDRYRSFRHQPFNLVQHSSCGGT
jgi:hypothetical protein